MTPRRRASFATLVLAVLLLHLLFIEGIAPYLPGLGAHSAAPRRLQAVFVRELLPSEPPAPVAAMTPLRSSARRAPRPLPLPASAPTTVAERAADAASVASAPERTQIAASATDREAAASEAAPAAAASAAAASQPQTTMAAASAPVPAQAASSEAASAQAAAAAPDAAASASAAFAWPPSTQLAYTLTGDVRGEVHGSAEVQWVHEGSHYQVRMDVIIGPRFAPAMQRHITSDGEITPDGLAPRRYDEGTKIAFGSTHHAVVQIGADSGMVTLANGRRVLAPPGLQDGASQFVQLTWLFLTGRVVPKAGARIDLPLALPRRVDTWTYDVVGKEPLDTPFGTIQAWHLKPRSLGDPHVLEAEAWFAPSLQYLPVRIVIHQGSENHIDLMIDKLPRQTLPAAAESPSPPAAVPPTPAPAGSAASP